MSNGTVVAICICSKAGEPMRQVDEVKAIAGAGLHGDRYCYARGSFNQSQPGKRQVTLINGLFFPGSGFEYTDSRRNIVTHGVELMDLIGKEFQIGEARLRGLKYCDPCLRPSQISGKSEVFKDAFHDRGGLVAEVIQSGLIRISSPVVPPLKKY